MISDVSLPSPSPADPAGQLVLVSSSFCCAFADNFAWHLGRSMVARHMPGHARTFMMFGEFGEFYLCPTIPKWTRMTRIAIHLLEQGQNAESHRGSQVDMLSMCKWCNMSVPFP
jgi:hypothetical protein